MTETITITWPELVNLASAGLASREPFDVAQGDLMARGIVAMDAAMKDALGERRAFLPASARPPGFTDASVERCLLCGTAVTPGMLIGNTLANGAMPKMAEQAMRAGKLYTDELGMLRKRVAELEALHDAAARANDALEQIGESARLRIVELTGGLREALERWADEAPGCKGAGDDDHNRLRQLAERAEAETPAAPRRSE